MDGQRQGLGQGRRRRNKNRSREQAQPKVEPVMIIARRPGAPAVVRKPVRGLVAASAAPKRERVEPVPESRPQPSVREEPSSPVRRPVRLVQSAPVVVADERERERLRLLDRLMASETRGAITRSADELRRTGHEFPGNQLVQLQLLEHFDEAVAFEALGVLSQLLQTEAPLKRPVFEQRLRRLEECADEPRTREAAASLRRTIRG